MDGISRRDALRLGVAGAAVPAALGVTSWVDSASAADVPASVAGPLAQNGAATPASWVVKPFDNTQVTLHPSLFTQNRDRNQQFLLNYPIDNMLYLFRLGAGL